MRRLIGRRATAGVRGPLKHVGALGFYGQSFLGERTTDGTTFTPWKPPAMHSGLHTVSHRLAGLVGARSHNYGIAGSSLLSSVGAGGYGYYVSTFVPAVTPVVSDTWPALNPPLVLAHGCNDIAYYVGYVDPEHDSVSAAYLTQITETLRSIMRMHRSSCVVGDTDTTRISYAGGTWTPLAGSPSTFLRGTCHYSTTVSDTFAVTLPPGLRTGQKVTLYFLGAPGSGADFSVSGAFTGTGSTRNGHVGSFYPISKTFTASPANSGQTVTVTLTAKDAGGNLAFFGFGVEAATPPWIGLVGFARAIGHQAEFPDAGMLDQRANEIALCAEFDTRVGYCDTDTLWGGAAKTAKFRDSVDGVHPSTLGAWRVAGELARLAALAPDNSLRGATWLAP